MLIVSVQADDNIDKYKKVILDEKIIYLTSEDLNVVTTVSEKQNSIINCKIANFTKSDVNNGNGIILLSSDKKAIIFRSSKRYIMMSELDKCKDGKIILHESPDTESQYNMVMDIDFDKNYIYPSLWLM